MFTVKRPFCQVLLVIESQRSAEGAEFLRAPRTFFRVRYLSSLASLGFVCCILLFSVDAQCDEPKTGLGSGETDGSELIDLTSAMGDLLQPYPDFSEEAIEEGTLVLEGDQITNAKRKEVWKPYLDFVLCTEDLGCSVKVLRMQDHSPQQQMEVADQSIFVAVDKERTMVHASRFDEAEQDQIGQPDVDGLPTYFIGPSRESLSYLHRDGKTRLSYFDGKLYDAHSDLSRMSRDIPALGTIGAPLSVAAGFVGGGATLIGIIAREKKDPFNRLVEYPNGDVLLCWDDSESVYASVLLSHEYGGLPTNVLLGSVIRKVVEDPKTNSRKTEPYMILAESRTRTSWKKVGEVWRPDTVEMVSSAANGTFSRKDNISRVSLKFDWLTQADIQRLNPFAWESLGLIIPPIQSESSDDKKSAVGKPGGNDVK